MVLPVRQVKGYYYVFAIDIVLHNHYFMSDSEIKRCLINGRGFEWRYKEEDLDILTNKNRKLILNSIYGKKDR